LSRTLITGATGFIGQAICKTLVARGMSIRATGRNLSKLNKLKNNQIETQQIADITPTMNWEKALSGCHTVVHLAARTHILHETASNPLEIYSNVNTTGTLNLAKQAAASNVKRFIFISSIKVNGEGQDTPYNETDQPAPQDEYAISKYNAELGLHDIASESGLEVIILRPPLVYGPGVGANFRRLLQAINNGWPLPLGGINNKRSLLYVENLADAVYTCIQHPQASGHTFLLSDGEDISTPELIRRIASSSHKPTHLWSIPSWLLRTTADITGKTKLANRLIDSLTVDCSEIEHQLNWSPPFSLQEGLNATTRWFNSKII
jgi:nucleoside-diphosphate-sugar epimerase